MTWYSIRKYCPIIGSPYLVRMKSQVACVAIYRMTLGLNYAQWEDEGAHDITMDVTHFALIEPVEIEE